MPGRKGACVLYWFRTDLRLHDSPALHAALKLKPDVFYPIWTWDPEYVYAHRVSNNRFNFLLESMRDLSASLTEKNPTTKLHVVRGSPLTLLPVIWKEWKITHLVYERDTAAYAKVRDTRIKELASEAGVEVLEVLGHSLYDPAAIVRANGGNATMSMAVWQKAAKGLPEPERPLPAPESLPPPGNVELPELTRTEHPVNRPIDLNAEGRTTEVTCYNTFSGPNGDFSVPTLEELGFPKATTSIRGGESEGLRRLESYCSNGKRVATFAKPKTSPADFDPPATTLLSPYLKFGCVGSREVFWRFRDTINSWKKFVSRSEASKETNMPENLEGQLLFREMYYAAEFAQGLNFAQIRGNSVCRYIDWHMQNQYDDAGKQILPRPVEDEAVEEWFSAWREGRTGFPWIDAIMRQLRQEGWIHHLARHSVACFLTRGQCYISWERGQEVFDEHLLDWDPCSNPGNWMWLSCSAFYAMYYRVYGVVSFPTKFDKTGKLVRKYCPELKGFPDKYIYCPHTAPLEVQKKAGCIIGKDYPEPMLDDATEKENCILRLKAAYAVGLHGSDKAVLDGTADKVLKEKYKLMQGESGEGKSSKRKGGTSPKTAEKKAKKNEGDIRGHLQRKKDS